MPLVSVVIPTFGRPELLKRAVDSVLAQTMRDLELIVVIDGHDQGTLDYLGSVIDPRLRYIAHERQRGAGQTRDTGADASRGRWVAFLDDDDEWLPQKLERQLEVAGEGPAVVMALSHVVTPDATFVRPVVPYDPGRQPIDEWLFDPPNWLGGGFNFLQTSSLLMPRALFDRLHFRDTKQHEEWELVIRAVKELGYTLRTASEPLVFHYLWETRASLSKNYTWRNSMRWISGLRPLVTPRAYSGFLLNTVGTSSASAGAYAAFWPLLREAFRGGSPTPRQLFRFLLTWLLPTRLRRRMRAALQGGKRPEDARILARSV